MLFSVRTFGSTVKMVIFNLRPDGGGGGETPLYVSSYSKKAKRDNATKPFILFSF